MREATGKILLCQAGNMDDLSPLTVETDGAEIALGI